MTGLKEKIPINLQLGAIERDLVLSFRRRAATKESKQVGILRQLIKWWLSLDDQKQDNFFRQKFPPEEQRQMPKLLPIQPEEKAILWPDIDIKRFLETLRKHRPAPLIEISHEILQEALVAQGEKMVQDIVGAAEVDEAMPRKMKGGKRPKAR